MKTFKILQGESYLRLIDFLFATDTNVFLLEGDLGAGKTTLVSQFFNKCIEKHKLKSINEVSSPTYSLINEYLIGDEKIFHADFYRLDNEPFEIEEVLEGIEDAKYSFIEWHSKLSDLTKFLNDFLVVKFVKNSDKSRDVTVSVVSRSKADVF